MPVTGLQNRSARRMAIGAELAPEGGVHFRVWAPRRGNVKVTIQGKLTQLAQENDGYHSGIVSDAGDGTLYRFRLDDSEDYPDPASRFQPEGPHGPSQVIDPSLYRWRDAGWKGLSLKGQVIYEMHIGAFTREGTWFSAMEQLAALAGIGITVIEVMPVADFPGKFGWGYDGVNMFAPTRLYGKPDDFRAFVNAAHALHMGVILDVVYNHFGPDGNYIGQYSRDYFTDKHETDWGEAINYDTGSSGPVREYFIANAGYWIDEFHLDGLRLDATQNIYDESSDHILAAIGRSVRAAANGRATIVVAENEPQHVKLVRPPEEGGYALDGLWNDDLHHSALVALTGHNGAYYTDYKGAPQELVSAIKYGYLYQGQFYKWQKQCRGTPSFGVDRSKFVCFIENHDQVANSDRGLRVHQLTAPGLYRAVTAIILLGPGTPMLFQGQEFGASSPFLFFADHDKDMAKLVYEGRRKFLSQWRNLKLEEMQQRVDDPGDAETFRKCKLDHSEREKNTGIYSLHCQLLRLRREDSAFSNPDNVDGAVLSDRAFIVRLFSRAHGDRLLVVNLGMDFYLDPAPEPLLAPPEGTTWRVLFSTEDPQYGGAGMTPLSAQDNFRLPGWTTFALAPEVSHG